LKKFKYKVPSELLILPYQELKDYRDTLAQENQRNAGLIKKGEMTKDESETLSRYRRTIDAMLQEWGKFHSNPKSGKGVHTAKNPYKLSSDYTFGNLYINPQKLLDLKIEAFKNGKKVLSQKADYDLIELLTKRYDSRKQYSAHSKALFSKLIAMSGLPLMTKSMKFTNMTKKGGCADCNGTCGGTVRYYKSPQELGKRLQVLIASKESGNQSTALDNEIINILNRLLIDEAITSDQYKMLHSQCIT